MLLRWSARKVAWLHSISARPMLAVGAAMPVSGGAGIEWQEGDALSLAFPDQAFDLVLCQQGLQFFSDRNRALSEMRRVLAAGGRG